MNKHNVSPPPISPSSPFTSRVQTEKTLQSSSAGAPVVKVDPGPSPKMEPLPTSTANTQKQSKRTANAVPTEEEILHAQFLKVAAEILEHHGLCRRERVMELDGLGKPTGRVLAIRLVFNPDQWTEELLLR